MGKKMLTGILIFILLGLTGCNTRVNDGQQVSKNEKIVIKFSHVVAENTPKGAAAQQFADLVRERTGGYVEVQVFPNSELYKDGEEFDALQRGDVQIIAPATSKLSGMFPEWQLLDLPYAFSNLTAVHAFLDGPEGKKLFGQLESKGMLGIVIWDNGFKQITNNRNPLIKPADFRGLRFRVMSSHTLQDQFEVLGATSVSMPFNNVLEALNTGGVDGEENSISNIFTQRFDQAQKYLTISNHGYLGYIILVNKEFWTGLPVSIRNILEDALAEVTSWEIQEAKKVNAEQLTALEKNKKIEIRRLSTEEQKALKQALNPVYDRLSSKIGPDLVNILRTP